MTDSWHRQSEVYLGTLPLIFSKQTLLDTNKRFIMYYYKNQSRLNLKYELFNPEQLVKIVKVIEVGLTLRV